MKLNEAYNSISQNLTVALQIKFLHMGEDGVGARIISGLK